MKKMDNINVNISFKYSIGFLKSCTVNAFAHKLALCSNRVPIICTRFWIRNLFLLRFYITKVII